MTNRLWVKLMGAFALVIAVGVVVTVVLTRQGAATQISHFMLGNQMALPADLQDAIGDYYDQHSGWTGIDTALDQTIAASAAGGMMGGMMAGMMGMFDNRIRIVDASGNVVADSAGQPGGSLRLSFAAQTWPVIVDDTMVGAIVIDDTAMSVPSSQDTEILSSLTRAVLSAALLAGLVALILGAVLMRQITRPLGQLSRASRMVAAGDLSARVPVHGRDEIAELAATFNQMAASLQSQESLRNQLVADIAHELRTPLAGIQGTVEALQDGVFEMTPEGLEPVYDQVMLLNRLVTDLRTLSLVEAGKLDLALEAVDIRELAERQIDLFRAQALDRDVLLKLEVQSAVTTVVGDQQRIGQVLGNLLSNAVRHTPPGGTVTVDIGGQDDTICMAVTNTGENIPPESLERVFERFHRLDSSRSRESGGSGLGLAIARRIVEAHGGRIWAQSPPQDQEQGTVFKVEIPLDQRTRRRTEGTPTGVIG